MREIITYEQHEHPVLVTDDDVVELRLLRDHLREAERKFTTWYRDTREVKRRLELVEKILQQIS